MLHWATPRIYTSSRTIKLSFSSTETEQLDLKQKYIYVRRKKYSGAILIPVPWLDAIVQLFLYLLISFTFGIIFTYCS